MEPFKKKGMEEKGLAHILAAFGFSMAGLRVLLRENAAQLECIALVVASVLFWFVDATLIQFAILLALFVLTLCIEALNTAIELIVDRTSPEISDYGKQVKDLGSFAVFCGLVLFGGFAAFVVLIG